MSETESAIKETEKLVAFLNADRIALTEAGCFVKTSLDGETVYFLTEEQYQQLQKGDFPIEYWRVLEQRMTARKVCNTSKSSGKTKIQ